jgi:hypothetical protein
LPNKIINTANNKIDQTTNKQDTEINKKIQELLGNETPEQKADETKKKRSADFISGLSGVAEHNF